LSDENVQIVRRLMTALNVRDLESMLALMDNQVEFFAPQTPLSVERKSPYRGHDGIRQYLEDLSGVWDTVQVIPREFRATDDHVVTIGEIAGERDGERLGGELAWAWKLRDGKIVWGRVYLKPEEALDDAGLS
jgi:ketosteroid isomerase-like protein